MWEPFVEDYDVDRILCGLPIKSRKTIASDKTLILHDEIVEVPAALQSRTFVRVSGTAAIL